MLHCGYFSTALLDISIICDQNFLKIGKAVKKGLIHLLTALFTKSLYFIKGFYGLFYWPNISQKEFIKNQIGRVLQVS